MPKLICPLCPYDRTSKLNLDITNFLKHVRLFHAHQPDFSITCGLGGCLRRFHKFHTFRDHVYAVHSGDTSIFNEGANDQESNSDLEGDEDSHIDNDGSHNDVNDGEHHDIGISSEALQKSSALLLLGLKEKHKLTQVALQGVIEGVTELMQGHLSALHTNVRRLLSQSNVSPSTFGEVDSLFSVDDIFGRPFKGLETQHQQLSYYSSHFNLIKPVRISLGERQMWKGRGSKRRCVMKDDEMFYVPILDTLQSLLQCDTILAEVESGHSCGSYLSDFCDGEVFRSHPLFSIQPTALQIFLYFDDLEVCNPIGSKAKVHKISIFYFTLGNIPPKFRSKLSSIYLVTIVKQKNLAMYGMDAILHPFVEDIKKLEKGHEFTVEEKRRVFYGTLAAVSADNLGSLALGGFKESCSSFRCCRHCMATQDTARSQFSEVQFELRDPVKHASHCAELESSDSASRDYGINRNSSLNSLRFFHVCGGGLLPDIMHDLLEGALQYEVKLMLKAMIQDEQYFSLEEFNSRLTTIELGYMEVKDRPTLIADSTIRSIKHTLKQSAAQMWLLARILPLVIGDLVPDDDDRWSNFLLMMDIVDLLFCPKIEDDHPAYLAALISDHHETFAELYPNSSIIPKMHFMVHMPRLMLKFGPLVRHWTMRYEAKHAYFKSLAQSMDNFINIPYTLAMRHQQYLCYLNATNPWMTGLTVGPGSTIVPAVLEELDSLISTAYEAKWVVVDGIEFKRDAAIVHAVTDDLPQLAKICNIYIINGSTIVFKAERFASLYNYHLRAYTLQPLHMQSFFYHHKLSLHIPLHIRSPRVLPGESVVIMPHHIS